jgi:hypothetical protein
MVETLPTLLTSQAEMERLFGADAIMYRVDDNEDGTIAGTTESSILDDVMLEATDDVFMYLESRYATADLENNRYARRAATTLAVHYLSQRCGNPEQYVSSYNRIVERLKGINVGTFNLSRMKTAHDEKPVMSNLVVDDRYRRRKIREQIDTSEGTTDGSQDPDWPMLIGR